MRNGARSNGVNGSNRGTEWGGGGGIIEVKH
jgi:hypothetical protein